MDERTDASSVNTVNNAPYLSADRSELAPLFSSPQENKGLKTIIVCFAVFSLVIALFLSIHLQYGDHQIIPHGSVVTDNINCSIIGSYIIKAGGNAIDGAIASTFCMTVVHPHLTGLGGGGLMIIYDQKQRRIKDCLDFRVVKSVSSIIGVPGFLAGLYSAHHNHGLLKWNQLILPSILLARTGFQVSNSLLSAKHIGLKDNSSSFYEWLSSLEENQSISNSPLGDTLEAIAKFGPDGNLTQQLIGANLSLADLEGYTVLRGVANNVCGEHLLNGYKVVLPSRGSGGPFVLKTLNNLNLTLSTSTPIAEIGKALLYGNNAEDSWRFHSGSVVVATDRSDLYVSIVSGLGSVLGAQILLPAGFILNNAIEITRVSNNRAVSLSVPFIAVDNKFVCGRRFISGAADARDAVQLLYSVLSSAPSSHEFNSEDVNSAVESPRVRFTTSSSEENLVWIEHLSESVISKEELNSLNNEGFLIKDAPLPYPSLNAIQKTNDKISAHADSRGEGADITF